MIHKVITKYSSPRAHGWSVEREGMENKYVLSKKAKKKIIAKSIMARFKKRLPFCGFEFTADTEFVFTPKKNQTPGKKKESNFLLCN